MSWEGSNRRQFSRATFPCLIKVDVSTNLKDSILTHTENISSGGICVILKAGLEKFSEVGLELDVMDGEDHLLCQGKVMWSVRRDGKEASSPFLYAVGITLLNVSLHDRVRLDALVESLFEREKRMKDI